MRWTILAMLTHAFLSVMTADQPGPDAGDVHRDETGHELIPLTRNEIRRLFTGLLHRPRPAREQLHWSCCGGATGHRPPAREREAAPYLLSVRRVPELGQRVGFRRNSKLGGDLVQFGLPHPRRRRVLALADLPEREQPGGGLAPFLQDGPALAQRGHVHPGRRGRAQQVGQVWPFEPGDQMRNHIVIHPGGETAHAPAALGRAT